MSKRSKGDLKAKEGNNVDGEDSYSKNEEGPITKNIAITLNALENTVTKQIILASLCVEHNNVVLGESDPFMIKPDFEEPPMVYNINFTVHLTVIVNYRESIDPIVSAPVLIKLSQNPTEDDQQTGSLDTARKKKKPAKPPLSGMANVLGICSLDLLPLLLGETSFTERLVVEVPVSFDSAPTSWPALPFLTVTVACDDEFFPPYMQLNPIYITVESIHNPLASFTENYEYTAGTIIYTDSVVPEAIVFEGGRLTNLHDEEKRKSWQPLWRLQNRAKLSKYCLDDDFEAIKNEISKDLDLKKKYQQDVPRVEWNSMYRCLLQSAGTVIMRDAIAKHRYWPFEFMITDEKVDTHKLKNMKEVNGKLYQCYVDLSELLFPGRTKTRVATQLYTYNSSEMMERTGLERKIFRSGDEPSKELKEPERRGKTSAKQGASETASDNDVPPSIPLVTDNNEPVFVVIEFQLHHPLVESHIERDFTCLMEELISSQQEKEYCHYPYSSEAAEEQYNNCIQRLAQIVTKTYRDFCEEESKKKLEQQKECSADEKYNFDPSKQAGFCYDEEMDELTCFTQYLHKTGAYLSIRSALKSRVLLLLEKKFKVEDIVYNHSHASKKVKMNSLNSVDTQNYIASVYTYLVERMNIAINGIIESRTADDAAKLIDNEKLRLYAEEAFEMGDTECARHCYLKIIGKKKTDPKGWIDYASFLLKIGDTERAIECCREAIILRKRHKYALITYGALLAQKHNFREAEIFLRAVTDFYPRFAEGWAVLHLFYVKIQYYPGIDITLKIAEKCMKDKGEHLDDYFSSREPLAWSTIHCPKDNIIALTMMLLFKLHLCEFADIALSEEMRCSCDTSSIFILYYMAVEHYLTGRFEDALSHLKKAERDYGMDYSVSSLAGHCYLHLGNPKEAMRCYEFAEAVFNRPDNLHLIYLKMGNRYIEIEKYERAKKVFLNACKFSPTPRTWLGTGIAFYHLKQYAEAEAALIEANELDNKNAEIWGYLCLLNLTLERHDEFLQCYEQAIVNNLKNVKLRLMITNYMEALGYKESLISFQRCCEC